MNDTLQPQSVRFPRSGEHYSPIVNETKDGYVHAHAFQTINADAAGLYELWSNVSLIPRWQEHVVSCTPLRDGVSHWVMGNPEDPNGKRVEFDSELTENKPGQKLAWKSITEGVEQTGSVTFTPHPSGRGTVVLLQQIVKMPGGKLGNIAASVGARGPGQTVIEDLRHFKELAESGAIPSVKNQPHGPRGLTASIKEWMYGETNPTPPGTSDVA